MCRYKYGKQVHMCMPLSYCTCAWYSRQLTTGHLRKIGLSTIIYNILTWHICALFISCILWRLVLFYIFVANLYFTEYMHDRYDNNQLCMTVKSSNNVKYSMYLHLYRHHSAAGNMPQRVGFKLALMESGSCSGLYSCISHFTCKHRGIYYLKGWKNDARREEVVLLCILCIVISEPL